ncbi:hypothetical protein BS78_02G281500 [Paspalum vaginatum]|nr:hypothetical protein BS78_02G281500 [Paspalum vaginatum]
MGMEKGLSEQQALKRLYGLLHRGPADEKLDETSRALLMKLLDDASHHARLRQAKTLSTASDSLIPIRPGLMFPKKMEQATPSIPSLGNNEETGTGMEKVSSDLQALERLYRLLHRGPSYENLDETSRALLIKMLDDASHQAVLRRAKMASGSSMSPVLEGKPIPSDRRTPDAKPRLGLRPSLQTSERPRGLKLQQSTVSSRASRRVHGHRRRAGAAEEPLLARLASNRSSRTALPPWRPPSPEPTHSGLSLHRPAVAAVASDRPRALNLQHSTVSSRASASRHGHGHRRAAEKPLLARLASNRSSRTALPPRRSPSPEPPSSGLSPLRLPVAAVTASQHGTVTASTRGAEHRDEMRRSFRRGDQSPPERSSRQRSASREPSLERPQLLLARDMEAKTSTSKHRVRRLDSVLSLQTTSRRGPERAGRGGATTPERSSSSDTTVSTRSRTGPNSVHLSAEEEESTPRRRRIDSDGVSSASWSSRRPRRTMNRMDSRSRYISSRWSSSPGSASLSPSASPTASPAPSASASYPSSPVYMSRQRSAWPGPAYAPEASGSFRRRRRRERQERQEEGLRWFKDKAVAVLHRLHDQGRERHERRVLQVRKIKDKIAMVLHHHHLARGQVAPMPSSSRAVRAQHHNSPWQYLGGMFQRTKGKDKKNPSRAVVGGPAKRHGGGGGRNMHSLFGATWQHFRGRQRAPAASLTKKGASHSRAQAKKMQWWQGLKGRRGKAEVTAGSRPRRRLL